MNNLYLITPKNYCYDEYVNATVLAGSEKEALSIVEGYFEPWQYPLNIEFITDMTDLVERQYSRVVSTSYLAHQ